jgi:putative PEP-CTERM system histidine kinase
MLVTTSYGLGAFAFFALIVLMLINRKPGGFGLGVLAVCCVTLLWALAAALQPWWMPGVAHLLEILGLGGWLVVLSAALKPTRAEGRFPFIWAWLPALVFVLTSLVFANDLRFARIPAGFEIYQSSQILARLLMAACGILMVENLFRNSPEGRAWHVAPFCIGMGALFAYELFAFAEAVVLGNLDQGLLAGRGVVLALIAPMLLLTMARNPDWRINVHVSRQMVLHTATLVAAGVFLIAAAGVAVVVGRLPGMWADISEVAFFCGSVIVLLTALSSRSLQSRLKRVVYENFFSTRYDYRTEWMRCIGTLSSSASGEPLSLRVIRALADVADSPSGALWLRRADGGYGVEQVLNMRLDMTARESAGGAFVAGFFGGEKVQVFPATFDETSGSISWTNQGSVWLAVPLMKVDQLIGFVALGPPRAPTTLNWESYQLLHAIGQQSASYLAEEEATRQLLESRSVIEYSRKFAFVGHDIKNVTGQISLIVANIEKFGDRAEFRADLVRGMESAMRKLRGLLDKMRPDSPECEVLVLVDPAEIILEVARELGGEGNLVRPQIECDNVRVRIARSDMKAILTHLVTNAIEASSAGDSIGIAIRKTEDRIVIEIADSGCGMSAEFVRDRLFSPRDSTKTTGHGMGAYQARELIRAAFGDIAVMSAAGRGTTIRIWLPNAGEVVGMRLPEKAAVS